MTCKSSAVPWVPCKVISRYTRVWSHTTMEQMSLLFSTNGKYRAFVCPAHRRKPSTQHSPLSPKLYSGSLPCFPILCLAYPGPFARRHSPAPEPRPLVLRTDPGVSNVSVRESIPVVENRLQSCQSMDAALGDNTDLNSQKARGKCASPQIAFMHKVTAINFTWYANWSNGVSPELLFCERYFAQGNAPICS